MKLRIPYSLLITLLASQSLFAETQKNLSQGDITSSFSETITEDTVYDITGNLTFSEITSSCFFKNSAKNRKITLQGDGSNDLLFSLENSDIITTGSVVFKDLNSFTAQGKISSSNFSGLINTAGSVLFENVGSVKFYDNNSDSFGGIIGTSNRGNITFKNVGEITFDSNRTYFDGGVIYCHGSLLFENITGNIQFTNNYVTEIAKRNGGAINSFDKISFINTKDILFEGNYLAGGGQGGAINAFKGLDIINAGDVDFLNNEARADNNGSTGGGGGICSTGGTLLSADNGNITFRGNTHGLGDSQYADGVYIIVYNTVDDPKKLKLRAQTGREIRFYDPLAYFIMTPSNGNPELDINKTPDDLSYYGGIAPDFSGTIRFSGAEVENFLVQATGESDEDFAFRLQDSRYSCINTTMNLHNGTLVIEDRAVLGAYSEVIPELPTDPEVPTDPENPDEGDGDLDIEVEIPGWGDGGDIEVEFSARQRVANTPLTWENKYGTSGFNLLQGTLEMRNKGILTVQNVSFSGQNAVLRTDGTAVIIADTIDMSNGVSIDFLPFLNNDKSGLFLIANSLTMGGTLGIADTDSDHYTDNRWKTSHRLMILDVSDVASTTGNFTGISSNAEGSSVIDSPYSYKGTWTYEWQDDQLFATWTPKGNDGGDGGEDGGDGGNGGNEIEKVRPELAGNQTVNSLWSTVSNMKTLGRTALGQVGAQRFLLNKNTSYWVSALGDFTEHKSVSDRDGYDYSGFGYAVGADTKLDKNFIAGVAFGNLYGKNKSQNYNSDVDQSSYIGMVYGAWCAELNKDNNLNISGTASYGVTANKLDTFYSDGDRSQGKWDNNAMRLTLTAEWNHTLNSTWTLTPFIGLEYDDARQKAFTESGDKARQFGQSDLRNLALPVGAGISHNTSFSSGMKWLNRLSLSYVPDIYRSNPEAEATRLSNGFSWMAEGINPVRNAGRVEYSTRFIFNDTWSTFGSYMLEGRKDALYHNINLGVSASF